MRVDYVDHMGTDLSVANAARRSFGKGFDTWSEEPRSARGRSDRELVEALAAERHLLPFRHPQITLSCEAPLPVARQLGKHQVGLSWSEVSRRYKTKDIEFFTLVWREAPEDRRQGSGAEIENDSEEGPRKTALEALQKQNIRRCIEDYDAALSLGASPEQARFLLPQSMEVGWTWTGSLLAWADLVRGRRHPDAQKETRDFADLVERVIMPLYPVSWGALMRGLPDGQDQQAEA